MLIGRLLRTMLTIKNKRISDDNPIPKLIDEKLWYLEKGLSAWQRDQLYSAKQKKTVHLTQTLNIKNYYIQIHE